MISPNILRIVESTMQDPSYSVLISKCNFTELCNKDKLEILLQQYNPNLEKIIENKENIIETLKETLTENDIEIPDLYELKINSCVNRTLTIESLLDFNTDQSMFISRLVASLSNELESNPNKKSLKINLANTSINITEKDSPNYFNRTKFRTKNSNLIISIPNKIETILIEMNKIDNNNVVETESYTENDIEENQIKIPYNNEFEYNINISYTFKEDVASHLMESITTNFEKEMEISFNNRYKKLPAIIITADDNNKSFSGYSLYFSQDENNNYIGVKILFENVRRRKNYEDINITIIGSGD